MHQITFRHASDLLRLTAVELGRHLGVPAQSVRQYRLDPGHPNHRRPPQGWERKLAGIARETARKLTGLADQLDIAD